MVSARLALIALLAFVPPLTDEQRTRLDTADEGRDHREEAFVALVENARGAGGRGGDDVPASTLDLDAVLDGPDAHRGELHRLVGVIQQQETLPRPFQDVAAWFLRDDGGRPILVYVADRVDGSAFAVGARIRIDARFYKILSATARDGTPRRYPAFVGARPLAVAAGDAAVQSPRSAVLLGLLVVLLVVFAAVTLWVRRQRGRVGRRRVVAAAANEPGDLDAGGPLPDDPVEALSELRRRAEPGE